MNTLLSDWKINKSNIAAIISDNASNIVKACHFLVDKNFHLGCFAHTLNLIVTSSIEKNTSLLSLLNEVKNIVKFFKQSINASDELRKITDKKLIQSVPTR